MLPLYASSIWFFDILSLYILLYDDSSVWFLCMLFRYSSSVCSSIHAPPHATSVNLFGAIWTFLSHEPCVRHSTDCRNDAIVSYIVHYTIDYTVEYTNISAAWCDPLAICGHNGSLYSSIAAQSLTTRAAHSLAHRPLRSVALYSAGRSYRPQAERRYKSGDYLNTMYLFSRLYWAEVDKKKWSSKTFFYFELFLLSDVTFRKHRANWLSSDLDRKSNRMWICFN